MSDNHESTASRLDYTEVCERIWHGYKLYSASGFVLRKGVELVGLAQKNDPSEDVAKMFYRRGESILEHQARVAWLASAFASNFPEFFGKIYENEMASYTRSFFAITVALCHDIGEVEVGDIPDDGRPEHGAKDSVELSVFSRMMYAYSLEDAHTMTAIFQHFQNKDSPAGQALFVLDKVEAVLSQLFLEQYEHYGAITAKPVVTDLDKYFMRATGQISSVDVWGAHAVSSMKDLPASVCDPILALLDVAARDVRGEIFPWRKYEIAPYEQSY